MGYKMLNIVPVKILTLVHSLEADLQNFKYVSGLQYLHVYIYCPEKPMWYGWDKYQEILDRCFNLKEVELTWSHFQIECQNNKFRKITLSQVSEVNQNIWKERISYFKARGIRIVGEGDIYRNKNLQTKLAKEAGVTWKFQFS